MSWVGAVQNCGTLRRLCPRTCRFALGKRGGGLNWYADWYFRVYVRVRLLRRESSTRGVMGVGVGAKAKGSEKLVCKPSGVLHISPRSGFVHSAACHVKRLRNFGYADQLQWAIDSHSVPERKNKTELVIGEVSGPHAHGALLLGRVYPEWVGFYPLPKCSLWRANP